MSTAPVTPELLPCPPYGTLPPATRTIRRKRGPSLSRRTGQTGSVFQQNQISWNPAAPTYGRFWFDSPEGRARRVIPLGHCATRTVAKRKLREYIETEGVNSKVTFITLTAPGTTFRQQAKIWISSLATRRRRPVKPATIIGWQNPLEKWILPAIGDLPLSDVSNAALKKLIDKMAEGGLAPKTIGNYAQVPKMVLASAVNAEGDQIYPREWNHDFVGLPIVDKSKQPRPTVTETALVEIINRVPYREAVLITLLAGTGLRIGEALALRATDFSLDFRVIHVTRSIWRGREQSPKTPAAVREIDIVEPLAELMRAYGDGKSGFIFATRSGRPLTQRNVHRAAGVGLHAFRRFRTETLRRARVPKDLARLWLGHAKETITDFYAGGLVNDQTWRREWCDRAGLGFSVGLFGARKNASLDLKKAA
jgi:integrase